MGKRGKRPVSSDVDEEARSSRRSTRTSLTRPISPPLKKRRLTPPAGLREVPDVLEGLADEEAAEPEESSRVKGKSVARDETGVPEESRPQKRSEAGQSSSSRRIFKSPFRLTRVQDLPDELNKDTITLRDMLGDPLISECWEFNYLHDIDFLMSQFDEDVRSLVKVNVVHGFWKKEDPHRRDLQTQASQYQNVSLHAAYLSEMFGTHHSKMLILLRHDGTAQVIIHTANMIVRDWRNMTQAAWLSPRLPLLKAPQQPVPDQDLKVGSGQKFKVDLLNYLRSYSSNRQQTCKPIIDQLMKYDFSAIRGSLICSVPGRHNVNDDSPTKFGWAALKQTLKAVPIHPGKSDIVIQISSIATLGPTDNWLKNTLFAALATGRDETNKLQRPKPDFKVVFPTPDEIRRSLDGYVSGGSIHTKIQSAQQAKQLQYLKPMLCHWANDAPDGAKLGDDVVVKEAGRKRAAPHVKTYIRYGNKSERTIDWALITSANLSKQAWGEAANSKSGEMRISSYEIGVLVWPGLFAEDAVMAATFLTDTPTTSEDTEGSGGGGCPVVGLRMPYNLPLQHYGPREEPWVATASYTEPDWMGQIWRGGDVE